MCMYRTPCITQVSYLIVYFSTGPVCIPTSTSTSTCTCWTIGFSMTDQYHCTLRSSTRSPLILLSGRSAHVPSTRLVGILRKLPLPCVPRPRSLPFDDECSTKPVESISRPVGKVGRCMSTDKMNPNMTIEIFEWGSSDTRLRQRLVVSTAWSFMTAIARSL